MSKEQMITTIIVTSIVMAIFIFLLVSWYLRFNSMRRITYSFRTFLYNTKYILAYTYARGGYLDDKLSDTSLCFLYAKEDGIYMRRMDRVFPVNAYLPYKSVEKIYIREGSYAEDIRELDELEGNESDKYYPSCNRVPAKITFVFRDENNKKKRLVLGNDNFVLPYDTDQFNYYAMLKNNFFAYIVPKMPDCILLKYNNFTSINNAEKYSKYETNRDNQ